MTPYELSPESRNQRAPLPECDLDRSEMTLFGDVLAVKGYD